MADLTEQLAAQLAQTITRTNSSFMTTQGVMDSFNRAMDRELRDYTLSLDKKGALDKEESEIIKRHLIDLKTLQLAKTKEIAAIKEVTKKTSDIHAKSIKEAQAQLAALQVQSAAANNLNADILDQMGAVQKTLSQHESEQRKINAALGKAEAELTQINEGLEKLEGEISSSKKILGDSIRGVGNVVESGLKYIFNPARLQKAGSDIVDAVQAEISTGMGLSATQFWHTASLGLNPKEFTEAMAKYRGAALAAGGLNNTISILDKTQGEYQSTIARQADRTEFAFKQMETLRKSGIKPLQSDTVLLQNSFVKLQKLTGMTGPQFQDMMVEMQDDAATQQALRSTTNEFERRAILTNIATRVQENVAMGMTIEQAKAATKTLNKLAGQTPIERIKQAAKLRAFGGAMGISGSNEAAQALMAGQRATKEQKNQLQTYLSASSNALSQSALGPMGGEIFSTQLSDKLGLNQLIGPGSDFNTVLTIGIQKQADAMDGVGKELIKANQAYETIINALNKNPLLGLILGGVGAIVGMMGGGMLKDMATQKILRSLETKIGGPGAGKGMAGIVEKGAGKNAAKIAERGAEKLAAEEVGKVAGKGVLKTVLKKIPVIGLLAGLGFGAGRAMGGDWTGAGMEVASGTASMVPGPGTVASLGIDAALIARDVYKDSHPEINADILSNDKAQAAELAKQPNKAEEATALTNTTMALDISEQVKQLTKSNDYLKQILESSESSNDLSGRMLVALTMSDANRAKEAGNLIGGNKFSAPYAQMG